MARTAKKELVLGNAALAANSRRKRRDSFADALRTANARAHERTNRRLERGDWKSIQASIAATAEIDDSPGSILRIIRWMIGLMLMPICWITTWTFLSQFSDATEQNFWVSTPAWYFSTGVLLMAGWFFSGLLRGAFLYFYVLGHELTHILFIWLFRGRVSDWGVSLDGGYVTTDKSNIVISLAPYFVPLWASIIVVVYAASGYFWEPALVAEKAVFVLTGFFWAFHLLWTLWMIPRDQPDLRENGTFLSLVIIYLINLLLLSSLLCLASRHQTFRGFGVEWAANAAEFSDSVRGWIRRTI